MSHFNTFQLTQNDKNSIEQIQFMKTTMFVHWHEEFEGSIRLKSGMEVNMGVLESGFWDRRVVKELFEAEWTISIFLIPTHKFFITVIV